MDDRALKVRRIRNFAVAALLLAGLWLAIDVLAHLDEFFEVAGEASGLPRVVAGHYSARLAAEGGSIASAIGLGAAIFALILDRRPRPLEARTEGG